jgi:hypothetical protein
MKPIYKKQTSSLKLFMAITFIFCFGLANAQTPGGVSAGLRTWYKADVPASVPSTTDGADVNEWKDQHNGDGAFQHAKQYGEFVSFYGTFYGNKQPQYRVAKPEYNYNPYIDFTKRFSSLFAYKAYADIANYRWIYTTPAADNVGGSLFAVGATNNVSGGNIVAGMGAHGTYPVAYYGSTIFDYGVQWFPMMWNVSGNFYGWHNGTIQTYDFTNWKTKSKIANVMSMSWEKYFVTTNGIHDRMDGCKFKYLGNEGYPYQFSATGPSLTIGNEYSRYYAGRWYDGGIPEVIMYKKKLNPAEGQDYDKVESYLALKYGVTLCKNYYSSDGFKVWDTACNKSYNKEIAGVIQDATSGLHQKQSHSIYPKTILEISRGDIQPSNQANANAVPNNNSMVWGSNGSGGKSGAAVPAGFPLGSFPCVDVIEKAAWSARKWLIQERGEVGNVIVYIQSKDAKFIDWTCPAYIVVADNEAFTAGVTYYPLTLDAGTKYKTASIDLGGSAASCGTPTRKRQYMAIAGKGADCLPGGVSGGLVLWSRSTPDDSFLDTSASLPTADYGQTPQALRNLAGGGNPTNYQPSGGTTYSALFKAPQEKSNFNPSWEWNTTTGYYLADAIGGNYQNNGPSALGYEPIKTVSLTSFTAGQYSAAGAYAALAAGRYSRTGTALPSYGFGPSWYDIWSAADYYSTNSGVTLNRNYASTYVFDTTGQYNTPGTYGRTRPEWLFQTRLDGKVSDSSIANSALNYGFRAGGRDETDRLQDIMIGNAEWGPAGTSPNSTFASQPGLMYDLIMYNRRLTYNEQQRVETYLGIRNGSTVLHNYLGTDNALLWDTAAYVDAFPNAAGYTRYNRSITGIGRDDAECMEQRVSRNTADTVLTIGLNSVPDSDDQQDAGKDFENNKEYIIWGSNGGAVATAAAAITTDLPAAATCQDRRLQREYRAQITGGANVGNYETAIRWQLGATNNILDTVLPSTLYLILDDDGDGDFATGAGPVRYVAIKSYDAATNTVLFDKVKLDPDGNKKVTFTLSWSNAVKGGALYGNTAAGNEGGGVANTASNDPNYPAVLLCTTPDSLSLYGNPTTKKAYYTVNWGTNASSCRNATGSVNITTPNSIRRKTNLNIKKAGAQYDSAAVLSARLYQIDKNAGCNITSPVKVRLYYDPVEIQQDSAWLIGGSSVNEKQLIDSTGVQWFKFGGDTAAVKAAWTASGLPEGVGAGFAEPLLPSNTGVENGINYVEFDNITSFSTFGWYQRYVRADPLPFFKAKVLLQGALLGGSGSTMRDDLRKGFNNTGRVIPDKQPYTAYPGVNYSGPEEVLPADTAAVFSDKGTNSIVDWVLLEFRDKANSSTVISRKAYLVQRDGDIVDPKTGSDSLDMAAAGINIDNYYVSVRHRNHLGIMLAATIDFSAANGALIDFTDKTKDLYNTAGYDTYEAFTTTDNKWALWAGNCNSNARISYTGASNDQNRILSDVVTAPGNSGGSTGFTTANGYYNGDVNMNGNCRYTGSGNDQNLLLTILVTYGLNTSNSTAYVDFNQQLP